METNVVKLKSDFNDIINIRNTVKNVFDTLQGRIDKLRQIYAEFINTNKSEMFVFGLDSFHFQSKLIDIEYDDMKRMFLAINNRMYCEYFKLHKIIVEYISKSVTEKKVSDLVKINNFPIYKDLEPFKEYKFETILDIHENILNLLGILMSILNNKENELLIHKTKQNIGLNIDNFITSFNFNISVMREKIMMFITYIEFFHKMHSKYLKRFSNKIQLMYTHISNDIKFDDSVEISKNKKKELIHEFATNNMDKTLLKELKTSIGSETNSETSSDPEWSKDKPNTPNIILNDSNLPSFSISSTSDKSKSNKFFNMNLLSGEKSKNDYTKIFKRNVNKVSDILQLCKPKSEKVIEPKLSDKDIEEMFYGIEESCDSIINEKTTNNSSSFDGDEVVSPKYSLKNMKSNDHFFTKIGDFENDMEIVNNNNQYNQTTLEFESLNKENNLLDETKSENSVIMNDFSSIIINKEFTFDNLTILTNNEPKSESHMLINNEPKIEKTIYSNHENKPEDLLIHYEESHSEISENIIQQQKSDDINKVSKNKKKSNKKKK